MSFDLVAVVDSQTYWFDEKGIDAAAVADKFDDESIENDGTWLSRLGDLQGYDEAVVLDVTASKELAQRYVDIAQQGIHLISANKVAGSADSQYYHQVQDAFAKIGRYWLYNATVGAGLPINHTVRICVKVVTRLWRYPESSREHFLGCSSSLMARCRLMSWSI